jgi:hypothetical protein
MATRTITKELLELELRFWQAMKEKDADAAVDLLDETGIVTGAQGATRLDRKTLVGMLKDQSWTIDDFEIADGADVLQLTDDVAVVARQICALHTESIIGDPFGRDRLPASATEASSRSR